jgi:hypothetical protein
MWLDQVRRARPNGSIGVVFRIHDTDGVTDRLIDGVLASASILASAGLIGRQTGPRVGEASIQELSHLQSVWSRGDAW